MNNVIKHSLFIGMEGCDAFHSGCSIQTNYLELCKDLPIPTPCLLNQSFVSIFEGMNTCLLYNWHDYLFLNCYSLLFCCCCLIKCSIFGCVNIVVGRFCNRKVLTRMSS